MLSDADHLDHPIKPDDLNPQEDYPPDEATTGVPTGLDAPESNEHMASYAFEEGEPESGHDLIHETEIPIEDSAEQQEPEPVIDMSLFHPLANAFPMIVGEEYDAFCEDLANNGQQEPIVMLDGLILDGRNRYRALTQLGVEPITTEYEGDSPLEFVLSMNIYRRQLTIAQRSIIAAEILYREIDAAPDSEDEGKNDSVRKLRSAITHDQAATLMGVSERSLSAARRVAKSGTDELLEAVKTGKAKISSAEYIARLEQDEQRELCTLGAKALREKAREMREERRAAVEAERGSSAQDEGKGGTTRERDVAAEDRVLALTEAPGFLSHPTSGTASALFGFATSLRREGASVSRVAETICQELAVNSDPNLEIDAIIFASDVIAEVRARLLQEAISAPPEGMAFEPDAEGKQ